MIEPIRDRKTVTTEGERVQTLPHGLSLRDATTQIDSRGTLCEIFDPRWGWHEDPLVFVYTFSIRPGVTKGWVHHKESEDRLFLVAGDAEVVLYDDRPDSPTCGLVSRVVMSQMRRQLMNIPRGVWHAVSNIGSSDCIFINCPTRPYDHSNPDKYRLPLENDYIPFRFDNPKGG